MGARRRSFRLRPKDPARRFRRRSTRSIRARLTALQGKSGADFDKAYVADQGENHSNALTLYADYMLWGEYEKLHALAIKMIPITEAQLKQAQVLAGD